MKRKILLNPGPATTTDSVKYAQVVSDICPREKEFGDLLDSIRTDLTKIATKFPEDYTCVLFGGSGTAVMESAISSVIPPDRKILIINNGAYGERFAKIAKIHKIGYKELKYPSDCSPNLSNIRNSLEDKLISCVAAVHHETTSGLLNPIKEIGEIAKQNNCSFVVDAISSYAGLFFDIKDYKIDYMLSTSNKCIQGMPGVSFVIAKVSELEKIKDYSKKTLSLDLYSQYEYLEKYKQTQFTPPVQTLYALRQAINEFFKEGAENRQRRYFDNWQILISGLEEIGFKILLPNNLQSRILTSVIEPKNPEYNFNRLHDLLYEKNFTIYPSKIGNMKTFRIANMGAINANDIKEFISELDYSLKEMGISKLEY